MADTTKSRHTAPDDELPPPPTSPTEPLAPFPPESARDRAPELYGFVALSLTYLLFGLYLLWALLPSAALETLGVGWYPNREWALRVPAWTLVAVLLTYWTHFAIALHRTPAFDDLCTLTDPRALPLPRHAWRADSPPEAYDLPIGLVNRALLRRDA